MIVLQKTFLKVTTSAIQFIILEETFLKVTTSAIQWKLYKRP